MAENSKIQWTHHTANLWWGCTEVHEGCDFCYAKALSNRYDGGVSLWGNEAPRRAVKGVWGDLRKFQNKAKAAGETHRVFVGSMMDIFEKSMPLIQPFQHHESTGSLREELFTQVTWGESGEGLYPNLMLLFLTKRPSNIPKMVPSGWLTNPPKNVMYGCSVVNQKTADNLVEHLIRVNGKRFLSVEPLLGPIKFKPEHLKQVHWVIVGGESGHGARPMHPDWVKSIRDQCAEAGVPFFFKQWGEFAPMLDTNWAEWGEYISGDDFHFRVNIKGGDFVPKMRVHWFGEAFNSTLVFRAGKHITKNFLDGAQHLNFPE